MNTAVFSRRGVLPNVSLLMYGKALERVNVFRLTWDEHIKKVTGSVSA